jgi:hypothetical protein
VSTLFKRSFDNIDPLTWYEIYDHEYACLDIHFPLTETTIAQYRKLSDPPKLWKFFHSNAHWGIIVHNNNNDISLIRIIRCMKDTDDGYIGIIGNELVSTPIQFKIDTPIMAECWFPKEDLTKHLVNIIMINGYYDDEEPLPHDTDDDVSIYERALLQRKYAFAFVQGKVGKTMKQTPGSEEGTSDTTSTQSNNIMFRHFFLVPPLLVATILTFNTGSSLYPSRYDMYKNHYIISNLQSFTLLDGVGII